MWTLIIQSRNGTMLFLLCCDKMHLIGYYVHLSVCGVFFRTYKYSPFQPMVTEYFTFGIILTDLISHQLTNWDFCHFFFFTITNSAILNILTDALFLNRCVSERLLSWRGNIGILRSAYLTILVYPFPEKKKKIFLCLKGQLAQNDSNVLPLFFALYLLLAVGKGWKRKGMTCFVLFCFLPRWEGCHECQSELQDRN